MYNCPFLVVYFGTASKESVYLLEGPQQAPSIVCQAGYPKIEVPKIINPFENAWYHCIVFFQLPLESLCIIEWNYSKGVTPRSACLTWGLQTKKECDGHHFTVSLHLFLFLPLHLFSFYKFSWGRMSYCWLVCRVLPCGSWCCVRLQNSCFGFLIWWNLSPDSLLRKQRRKWHFLHFLYLTVTPVHHQTRWHYTVKKTRGIFFLAFSPSECRFCQSSCLPWQCES